MNVTSRIFTEAIALEPASDPAYDVAFGASTQPCPWPKAYGGDLVAQALAAAMRSVDGSRLPHSMHSYFLRPADVEGDVRYEVEVLRDGRGYSTRHVRGLQHGKVVYTCLTSFASSWSGREVRTAVPTGVPAPDTLPSAADYLASRQGGTLTPSSKAYWSHGRSFDIRHVPGPVYLTIDGDHGPHQATWIRAFDPLRGVQGLSAAQRDLAALAYVCDYTILEPVLRTAGLPWATPGLTTASLDHAMWIHGVPEPGALDGWLLYTQQALGTRSGRGLGSGQFFDSNGHHLATVVQEGLIRVEADAPDARQAT